ncbi:MAG TPA: bifunctional transaldolase/phosoglucose isomerase [Terriglobia bacterium]|nr:bifunctional transaldolase/phosoglucose isomerase [Terriglobia bacterium]
MNSNPLRELNRLGQSVWQDYIRRGEMLSGDLKRVIDEDGTSGVTSNPTIFEKAITGSKDYDQSIRRLVEEGLEGPKLFERLAVEDIQMACDLFRPVYDETDGADGFVSIEVSPKLARDTEGSVAEARRLWHSVNRPNVMVKIPGTKEGLPAIEACLAEGININITLLFAVERYVEVANAYLRALERRVRDGKPVDRLASVASFFVSRIDTLIDQQLSALLQTARPDQRPKIEGLMGKVAIANAKVAYQEFKRLFSSSQFQALAKKGARVQRVLWASTSTKNAKYRDVLYVENLVGRDTINTLPPATAIAFRDHGKARLTLEEGLEDARQVIASLGEVGIDLRAVTLKLENDGVEAFSKDYDKLLQGLAEKRQKILAGAADRTTASLGKLQGAVDATLKRLDEEKFSRRLWDRDPSLWKKEPEHQKIIKNALGWLTVSDSILEHVAQLTAFVDDVRRAGFQHAVVLGMGGSSLCPDVCRATFGTAPGYLQLHVLDSTVPGGVAALENAIDVAHTLFLVSSKSGGTTESLTFFKYFHDRVRRLKGDRAGENFVAITDPGTSLEKLAREHNFRTVIYGEPDIGGRYSALSNFGIVPAALEGVDVRGLLERAERMVHACGCCVPSQDNPGVKLGVILAEAGRAGRDKVTLVTSPSIATFADWAEQLIAESTGKEGKGLVPVAGEELGDPASYGADRLFVYLKLESDAADPNAAARESKLRVLEAAGHPVVRISVPSKLDIGQEFFRWEVATATAGSLLGIDAFDQPNVQESKDNTNRLLAEFRSTGKLPQQTAAIKSDGIQVYARDGVTGAKTIESFLAGFLRQARPGDYIALMAYLERTPDSDALLGSLRTRLRDATRLATTLGYGPRFLHSTGQLHKGGSNNGVFIQITADDAQDLAIPGEPYTFSVLKQAQALGDLQSLEGKKRRVVRIDFGGDARSGLGRLSNLVDAALGETKQAGAAHGR